MGDKMSWKPMCALALLLALPLGAAHAQTADAVSVQDARQIAEDAYIYGYPLVTMEMTRRVMTNVAEPEATRAPMGHLLRVRAYPNAQYRDVTAPNADTLYTTGWIDVGKEPWILSLPEADGRYYLFPMLDGWTTVFQVPGKRTTCTGPQSRFIAVFSYYERPGVRFSKEEQVGFYGRAA